jgi:hypothetical protein
MRFDEWKVVEEQGIQRAFVIRPAPNDRTTLIHVSSPAEEDCAMAGSETHTENISRLLPEWQEPSKSNYVEEACYGDDK